MAVSSLRLEIRVDPKPIIAALRAYEGEAQYAVAAAQRSAAAATVRDTKAQIAADLGMPGKVLAKQLRVYSRKRLDGWQAKAWLGHKAKLWPRQHEAIAVAALRAGYRTETIKGKIEYVKGEAGALRFFSIDLDTEKNRARLETAGRYHSNATYRVSLAREVDRRLARLGGGRKLGRKEIGLAEARMRRLLSEEISP